MAAWPTSAQQRALIIPGILDSVFAFSSRADNASYSRLCRRWSDIALNYVWREDPPLKALFSLLGPLVPISRDGESNGVAPRLVFSQPIEHENWEKFALYAKRVRMLTLTRNEPLAQAQFEGILDGSVFLDVALARPVLVLFPYLEFLDVEADIPVSWLRFCTMILHETVMEVSVDFPSETWSCPTEVAYLIREISRCSPSIRSLRLIIPPAINRIEPLLCDALQHLLYLVYVAFSSCMLTTRVLESLALLPELEEIDFNIGHCNEGVISDMVNIQPYTLEGAFPKLEILATQSSLSNINTFFLSERAPTRLVVLEIDMLFYNTSEDLRQCIQTLSQSCHELRVLSIMNYRDPLFSKDRGNDIAASALSPLKSLSLLGTFQLDFPQPIDITDRELVDLVNGCPLMRNLQLNLQLNSEPLSKAKSSLTLGCLALLTQEGGGKHLEQLSIYVDASNGEGFLADSLALINLKVISFGFSPVKKNDDLLVYLSRVLPSSCAIDTHWKMQRRTSNMLPIDLLDVLEERHNRWDVIKDALSLFYRIRRDERGRLEGLYGPVKEERVRSRTSGSLNTDSQTARGQIGVVFLGTEGARDHSTDLRCKPFL